MNLPRGSPTLAMLKVGAFPGDQDTRHKTGCVLRLLLHSLRFRSGAVTTFGAVAVVVVQY